MRNVLVAVAVMLFAALFTSTPAHAQLLPKVEAFGGYSYLRFNPSSGGNFNLNGWNGSLNIKPISFLGIVGDFSGTYGNPSGVKTNLYTYMVGPQLSFPAKVSPFVHVLLGGARLGVPGASTTDFATAFGGGIDVHSGHHLGFRLFQVDDVVTRFGSGTQNSPRVSAGILLRF